MMTPSVRIALLGCLAGAIAARAFSQTGGSTSTQPTAQPIDACGTLVQAGSCVVFEGGGGRYVLADYGRFRAGDAVRVVGTTNPNCHQICPDADGCISGVTLYDPAVWPCGTPIPSLQQDLVPAITSSVCSALGSGAVGLMTLGALSQALLRRR